MGGKVSQVPNNTTGMIPGKGNINNSGGSSGDESAKEQEPRARSSSLFSNKDRAYSGFAYSEENYASSALAKQVRRSTKKLIAEGKM